MVCDGCGDGCIEEVEVRPACGEYPAEAFIQCPHDSDIGRVPIPLERLHAWVSRASGLADWLAKELLSPTLPQVIVEGRLWWVGALPVSGVQPNVLLVRGSTWPDNQSVLGRPDRLRPYPQPIVLALSDPGDCRWLPERTSVVLLRQVLHFTDDYAGLCFNRDRLLKVAARATELPAGKGSEFRQLGDLWVVSFNGKSVGVKDMKGLGYIRCLLEHPRRDIHVFDLVQLVEGYSTPRETADNSSVCQSRPEGRLADDGLSITDLGDAGDVLDKHSRKEYVAMLARANRELGKAQRRGDARGEQNSRDEIAFIERALRAEFGLRGEPRRAASAAERARVNTQKLIVNAIGRIDKDHPLLALHLKNCISTGTFCMYSPDSDITWDT